MDANTFPVLHADSNKSISSVLVSVIKPTLFLFLLWFPLSYMQLFLHEGGHALVNLIYGARVTLFYVHPFSFVGYVRPMHDYYNVWVHVSGTIVEILVSITIFALLWKHRSFYTLPFLMIFPWIGVYDGIGGIVDKTGDFHNLVIITGMSENIFLVFDIVLAVVGIFFFLSLLPLLGLAPEDKKSLFVLPVSMLLYSLLGLAIAHLLVPGSLADVQYHLEDEILVSAKYRPLFSLVGVLLFVIYMTVYRWVYKKLPAGLRMEKVNLSWRDLSYPGLLFTISMILGIIVVH
jgi:hypothetical protein